MHKTTFLLILLMGLLGSYHLMAQTLITGQVTDKKGEPLVGANIRLKDGIAGTVTNGEGKFELNLKKTPPLTLQFSFIGYVTQEISIEQSESMLTIELIEDEGLMLGGDIVVSASRVEESILESPVSIEQLDILEIRSTASPSFYDALINLKGVDMSTQSLTLKTPNSRGFGSNGNLRFAQIIDGMDNQAPGLNFAVGNIVGISELDLESIELLPGATSALYGPGAINGTLLMTSKNPFNYQGLSAYVKTGVMHLNSDYTDAQPMFDVGVRYAKAFNNKFAFKVNFSYIKAEDWYATDYRDRNAMENPVGRQMDDLNFDGVNIYGDVASANLQSVAKLLIGTGRLPAESIALIPNTEVSRTGYHERDLADYNTQNFKANASLHYRFSDDIEGIFQVNYGTGTAVYTGANRYSFNNLYMTQIKAEVKGSNFFVRAYTTQENSGDSYDAVFTGLAINNTWSSNQMWFGEYVGAFVQAKSTGIPNAEAHQAARTFADRNRYLPNSPEFNATKKDVTSRAINAGLDGSKFNDATNLYQAEGMYNFNKLIDPEILEIVTGASYRMFDLNSNGTIFPDADNDITISEYGIYTQISKRLLEKRLKVTVSGRYDKNENFDGRITPRLALVYSAGAKKEHHFRASIQTGFRNPSSQGQYIDLNLGDAGHLLGGLPQTQDAYFTNNPVYTPEVVEEFKQSIKSPAIQNQAEQDVIASGVESTNPNFQALVEEKATELAIANAPNILTPYKIKKFQPESVTSFEVGYKGLINNKLFIDAYFYQNEYQNFESQQILVQPTTNGVAGLLSANTQKRYQIYSNATDNVRSWGWALGLDWALPKNYTVGASVSSNQIQSDNTDESTQLQFNTPPYRLILKFGNREVTDNFGFNVVWRWQDSFLWESTFGVGDVEAYSTLDAQVSYKLPKIKSILKVGGSNILNQYYIQTFGNPSVGALWYISLTFDEMFN